MQDVLLHELPAVAAIFSDVGAHTGRIVEDLGDRSHDEAGVGVVAADGDAMFAHGQFAKCFQAVGAGGDGRIAVVDLDGQVWGRRLGGEGHEDPTVARIDELERLGCRAVLDRLIEQFRHKVVELPNVAAVDGGKINDGDRVVGLENRLPGSCGDGRRP